MILSNVNIDFAVKLYFYGHYISLKQEEAISFKLWWRKFKRRLVRDTELQRRVIHIHKIYKVHKQRLDIFEINKIYIDSIDKEDI